MMIQSPNRSIGIMACESSGHPPFAEREFYAWLCRVGHRTGMRVFVFSPLAFDPGAGRIRGYTCMTGKDDWIEGVFPLPDILYDRTFLSDNQDRIRYRAAIRRLLAAKPMLMLGRNLNGKWSVYRKLQRDPALQPFLPKTALLTSPRQLLVWLHKEGRLFLKPDTGTHGKGTVRIRTDHPAMYRVQARTLENESIERSFTHFRELWKWLMSFAWGKRYLIQPDLALACSSGEIFDIRSLVQKNGRGLWELTGMAVRVGQHGSITSNLHGGGRAEAALPFLQQEFGQAKARQLVVSIRRLSRLIPPALEASGGRLAELGIDFGIDRHGRIWILEVNSKPGRSIFRELQLEPVRKRAMTNPIAYARYLLQSGQPAIFGERKRYI